MSYLDSLEADRRKKVEHLRSQGVDPYGHSSPSHWEDCTEIMKALCVLESADFDPSQHRVLQGRIVSKNNRGKLKFFFLQDHTAKIQLMFSKGDFGDAEWEKISQLDVYDHVGVRGNLLKTQTGEPTLKVYDLIWKGKSIAPPPEKFHGIKDEEVLVRQRYLAMIQDRGLVERLCIRSHVLSTLRTHLKSKGYIEVETPVLSIHANGAIARPFLTHHNALDEDLVLRIAPELDLKRLMVGGLERIYELGKVFRNEGVDATHNPEFTILELYEAYADAERMMNLCEQLVSDAYQNNTAGSAPEIQPFRRVSMKDLFFNELGLDLFNAEGLAMACPTHGLPVGDYTENVDRILDLILHMKAADGDAEMPLFVTGHPAATSPLARRKNNLEADRFELYVFYNNTFMELANGYSELNDPDEQLKNFLCQSDSKAEAYIRDVTDNGKSPMSKEEIQETIIAFRNNIDHDYIHALKIGMPMAGGLGIGVDRLVMWLTGSHSIRDVIAFPLAKKKT